MTRTPFFSAIRRWSGLAAFLIIGVVFGFIISSNSDWLNRADSQPAVDGPRPADGTVQFARSTAPRESIYPINSEGRSPFVAVVENVRDAVVNIRAERIEKLTPYQQRWLRFWGYPQDDPREVSMGTGFFFREDGYILTNHHVIAGAKDISVTLADYREVKARLIGEDPATDLAVIKISGESYPHIDLGDSDSIKVGEWVVAIGNPFPSQGLDRTVTVGVVSAKGRRGLNFGEDSPEFQDYIQTDAAINPGNSGGPLVDLGGYVIGINSAIATSTGQSAGIGFAIPSNLVRSILPDLMKGAKIERGWLGVVLSNLDPVMAEANGLQSARGALIREVKPGSPAELGGLKDGDIVTKFNDQQIDDMDHFRYLVAQARTGSTVKMTGVRKGKPMTANVTLGDRERGLAENFPAQAQPQNVGSERPAQADLWFGMAVETATPDLAEQHAVEYRTGVIVTYVEPGSLADIQGITPGTILIEIDHQDVKTKDDFLSLKERLKDRTKAIALIGFDVSGNVKYFAIKPS
ncbi:MAG: Do family serine endopeptidase [candidate division Zixibacteria bacterium]|nr:Do family serine endopeptidase [candidate division Zixibacteria bacterium]